MKPDILRFIHTNVNYSDNISVTVDKHEISRLEKTDRKEKSS